MRFADVNVLIRADRPEAPRHDDWLEWLERARIDDEPLTVTDHVPAGFVRLATHPRIFKDPTPAAVALDFVSANQQGRKTDFSCRKISASKLSEICKQISEHFQILRL